MVQGQGWAADRSLDMPWDYDWGRGGQDCQRRRGSVHNCCHCDARGLHKCPHTIYICSCSSTSPRHSRRGALGSLNLIPPLPTVAPSHPQEKPHLPAPMRPSDGMPPSWHQLPALPGAARPSCPQAYLGALAALAPLQEPSPIPALAPPDPSLALALSNTLHTM